MISRTLTLCLIFLFSMVTRASCQNPSKAVTPTDYVRAFKDTLSALAARSDDIYLKMHFTSMIAVIDARYNSTYADTALLVNAYHAFNNTNDPASPKMTSTYRERRRPLIFSWVSPHDGNVSFSWLTLPKNWDPSRKYPLYIQLHGLWAVANSSIEYMTWPFLQGPSYSNAFEDGYYLSPWARGNYWYRDISEIDIWECMAAVEDTLQVDQSRKYITGHSMGGYGAWSIASQSPEEWAAVGIYAGALGYHDPYLLNIATATQLKDIPVYFVCGTNDHLLGINQQAFQLLSTAGNKNILFITFNGGHEYTDANVRNMYFWLRNHVNQGIVTLTETPVMKSMNITCYPNPASTNVTIHYTLPQAISSEMNIYDSSGRFVRQIINDPMIQGSIAMSTEELNPGLYFILLKSPAGSTQTKMIINK